MTAQTGVTITHENNRLSMVLPSTMEAIDQADQESRLFLQRQALDAEIFSVCLCLREGLTNAVRHGNQNNLLKQVQYTLIRDGMQLTMVIQDEGDGFDWKAAAHARPDEVSDHGRGLMIMRKYFSAVGFNQKGNRLTLVKDLSGSTRLPGPNPD